MSGPLIILVAAALAVGCSERQERKNIVTLSGPGQVNICERPSELGCAPTTTPAPVFVTPVITTQPLAQMAKHNLIESGD